MKILPILIDLIVKNGYNIKNQTPCVGYAVCGKSCLLGKDGSTAQSALFCAKVETDKLFNRFVIRLFDRFGGSYDRNKIYAIRAENYLVGR